MLNVVNYDSQKLVMRNIYDLVVLQIIMKVFTRVSNQYKYAHKCCQLVEWSKSEMCLDNYYSP